MNNQLSIEILNESVIFFESFIKKAREAQKNNIKTDTYDSAIEYFGDLVREPDQGLCVNLYLYINRANISGHSDIRVIENEYVFIRQISDLIGSKFPIEGDFEAYFGNKKKYSGESLQKRIDLSHTMTKIIKDSISAKDAGK